MINAIINYYNENRDNIKNIISTGNEYRDFNYRFISYNHEDSLDKSEIHIISGRQTGRNIHVYISDSSELLICIHKPYEKYVIFNEFDLMIIPEKYIPYYNLYRILKNDGYRGLIQFSKFYKYNLKRYFL